MWWKSGRRRRGVCPTLAGYLEAHPAFYGSAVALLGEDGTVATSPYVHRTADGYNTLDLATPSYNIEAQDWFTMPLAANTGIWTPPTLMRVAVRAG